MKFRLGGFGAIKSAYIARAVQHVGDAKDARYFANYDPRMKREGLHYVVVERDEKYMASFDEMVPEFIEKWTRHWLKLVLYLGSNGNERSHKAHRRKTSAIHKSQTIPFCGCPSVTVKAISGYYRAKCNGCESRTGYGGSEKKHSNDGINEPLEIIMEVFMYKITATIEKKVALLLTG